MTLELVIEALVFASQKPLAPREIVAALRSAGGEEAGEPERALAGTKEEEVLAALEAMRDRTPASPSAFHLVEKAAGWQFVTDPHFAPWVRQLYPESKPTRLSGPALETLAIIAYRQPITRADIEAVRGVAVDGMVNQLLERSLIRIAGRAEQPGRPLLYETTAYFLEHFGLKQLEELPNSSELRRMNLPTAPITEEAPVPAPAETPAAEVSADSAEASGVADPGTAEPEATESEVIVAAAEPEPESEEALDPATDLETTTENPNS